MEFTELGLNGELLKALEICGYTTPTEVQEKTIPVILQHKDIVVRSQTGSGKTMAYGLPIIQNIDADLNGIQVLVVCPTRELASQVTDELRKLTKFIENVKVVPIFGGSDISRQIKSMKGAKIIVGTPGRIMDHMRRRTLKFHLIKAVILDEADEMLDMGFKEDIETILKDMPKERQNLMFSATFPAPIKAIISNFLNNPVNIEVGEENHSVKNIEQVFAYVSKTQKNDALNEIIKKYNPKTSIIFCNTKIMVDTVAGLLIAKKLKAVAIHGDLKQNERKRVMTSIKAGEANFLVATDVAARGIDINDVDYIINFDLPYKVEHFLHRIGRTARAGKTGTAISIVTTREQLRNLKDFESKTKSEISEITLEGISKPESNNTVSKSGGRNNKRDFSNKSFDRSPRPSFSRRGPRRERSRDSRPSSSRPNTRSRFEKDGEKKFEKRDAGVKNKESSYRRDSAGYKGRRESSENKTDFKRSGERTDNKRTFKPKTGVKTNNPFSRPKNNNFIKNKTPRA